MKRILKTLLILTLAVAIAVSSSGCITTRIVLQTEREASHKPMIQRMLREKYGEKFIVHKIRSEGGRGGMGVLDIEALFDFSDYGTYYATCSPASNPDIIFEAQTGAKCTYLDEGYPQAIVEYQAKKIVEEVVSKYTDDYILYTYVSSPFKSPDIDDATWEKVENAEPFTSAEQITIESYVDKYYDTTYLVINLFFNDDIEDTKAFSEKVLDEINDKLNKLDTLALISYMDDEIKKECSDYMKEKESEYDPRIDISYNYDSDCTYYYSYRKNKNTDYKWELSSSKSKNNH
ncbi:MAG: hypothetical protein E7490_08695 [Ruminococcaceae bacterium]|nr:hypothetical protein [Oscillospiraceae bacterium]